MITLEQGGGPRDGLFDDIVYEGNSDLEFTKALREHKLIAVNRKGKQLWLDMGNNESGEAEGSVLFHFGMTGSFVIQGEVIPQYKSFKIEKEAWPPRYCKCEIVFDNGKRLAFCDPRRIGRIKLREFPLTTLPISKLASDPTQEGGIDLDEFVAKVQSYSSSIKAVLLDQEKVICGIGNWIADEVLYQSNIHPETVCNTMSTSTLTTLAQTIETVCIKACECTTTNTKFPEHYLFHYRWVKGKGTMAKDYHGKPITFITAGGRTSAVVMSKQKKTGGEKKAKAEQKKLMNEQMEVKPTSSKYFKEAKEEGEKRTAGKQKAIKAEVKEEQAVKKKRRRKA